MKNTELAAHLKLAHERIQAARSTLQIAILDMEDGDDEACPITRTDDDVVGGMIALEGVIERLLRA